MSFRDAEAEGVVANGAKNVDGVQLPNVIWCEVEMLRTHAIVFRVSGDQTVSRQERRACKQIYGLARFSVPPSDVDCLTLQSVRRATAAGFEHCVPRCPISPISNFLVPWWCITKFRPHTVSKRSA